MLSPSDFNNAVPQFTNGNYASNPLNPQYIAEPSSTEYNRGVEPLTTLPAQWWNWFVNKFTARFNKVNIYVKNIFNELSQLLSLVEETPSGTEADPTIGQLKGMFQTKYPEYLKDTFVTKTTEVNGHALSSDVTVTKSDVGLGDVVNTGDSATPTDGGTTKFTTGGAYTELAKKVDTTRKVNGHALSADVTVTKSDVGLGSVVNTGDSATPVSGGTTKFTTGGAYTELAKKAPTNHASSSTTYGIASSTNYGHIKTVAKLKSESIIVSSTSITQTIDHLGVLYFVFSRSNTSLTFKNTLPFEIQCIGVKVASSTTSIEVTANIASGATSGAISFGAGNEAFFLIMPSKNVSNVYATTV